MSGQDLCAIVLREDDVPNDDGGEPAFLVDAIEPCRLRQLLVLDAACLNMNRSYHIVPGEIRNKVCGQIIPADLSIISQEKRLVVLSLFRGIGAGEQIPEMMMGIDDRNGKSAFRGQACQQVGGSFQVVSPSAHCAPYDRRW